MIGKVRISGLDVTMFVSQKRREYDYIKKKRFPPIPQLQGGHQILLCPPVHHTEKGGQNLLQKANSTSWLPHPLLHHRRVAKDL